MVEARIEGLGLYKPQAGVNGHPDPLEGIRHEAKAHLPLIELRAQRRQLALSSLGTVQCRAGELRLVRQLLHQRVHLALQSRSLLRPCRTSSAHTPLKPRQGCTLSSICESIQA
jgi:hypothetical protein